MLGEDKGYKECSETAAGNSVDLQYTECDNCRIVWKVFHDSITLILVTKNDDTEMYHCHTFLDFVFNSLVFGLGLDELMNIKNVERLRSKIKASFHILDVLLESLLLAKSFSLLTMCANCTFGSENTALQAHLDGFTAAAQTVYGCLLAGDKVVVATANWWQLSAAELVLIPLLVSSLSDCTAHDVAVFLPQTSPKTPHRLLVFSLLHGVKVCVICGPTPELFQVERKVESFWLSALETSLKNLLQANHSSSLPVNGSNSNILGFLLVNKNTKRSCHNISCPDHNLTVSELISADASLCHSGDSYIITDTHQCYVLHHGDDKLYLLFNTSVPTYMMRSLSQKMCDTLVSEKWLSS